MANTNSNMLLTVGRILEEGNVHNSKSALTLAERLQQIERNHEREVNPSPNDRMILAIVESLPKTAAEPIAQFQYESNKQEIQNHPNFAPKLTDEEVQKILNDKNGCPKMPFILRPCKDFDDVNAAALWGKIKSDELKRHMEGLEDKKLKSPMTNLKSDKKTTLEDKKITDEIEETLKHYRYVKQFESVESFKESFTDFYVLTFFYYIFNPLKRDYCMFSMDVLFKPEKSGFRLYYQDELPKFDNPFAFPQKTHYATFSEMLEGEMSDDVLKKDFNISTLNHQLNTEMVAKFIAIYENSPEMVTAHTLFKQSPPIGISEYILKGASSTADLKGRSELRATSKQGIHFGTMPLPRTAFEEVTTLQSTPVKAAYNLSKPPLTFRPVPLQKAKSDGSYEIRTNADFRSNWSRTVSKAAASIAAI